MNGQFVALEPLVAEHEHPLWQAASAAGDAALWDYLPYGPFGIEAEFSEWFRGSLAAEDLEFFAVVPKASGLPAGMLALMRDEPAHRVVEVGHVWFGPELQRTTAATEALGLVMGHVFEDRGYRRLEWKCNAANARSRRAAERTGFTYEGTFRQHMIVKGENRDTAWFSILDSEWPTQKTKFERWLDPGNFGLDGKQRAPLG